LQIAKIVKDNGICKIYGPVGIGKTTILRIYSRELMAARKILPILFKAAPTGDNIRRLINTLVKTAKKISDIELQDLYLESEDYRDLEKILATIRKKYGGRRIILLVDDAHYLLKEELSNILKILKTRKISGVLASIKPLGNSREKNFVVIKPLSFDEFNSFAQMILKIVNPDTIEHLYHLTNGYPLYAVMFSKLFLKNNQEPLLKLSLNTLRKNFSKLFSSSFLRIIGEGIFNTYSYVYGREFIKALITKPLSKHEQKIVHDLRKIGLLKIRNGDNLEITDPVLKILLREYVEEKTESLNNRIIRKHEENDTQLVFLLKKALKNANITIIDNTAIRVFNREYLIEIQKSFMKERIDNFVRTLRILKPTNAFLVLITSDGQLNGDLLKDIPSYVKVFTTRKDDLERTIGVVIKEVKSLKTQQNP